MADKNELPPAYSELQPMLGGIPRGPSPAKKDKDSEKFDGGAPASAPLLTSNTEAIETLSRVLSTFPSTVMLKTDPASTGKAQPIDPFFLRDSVDILLAKGEVSKPAGQKVGFNQITMQGLSSAENLLEITCDNGNCAVFHRNTKIGALTLDLSVPQSVRVTESYDDMSYSVNFSSPDDITVSKGTGTGGELICRIHIPTEVQVPGIRMPGYVRRSNEVRFDGTLVFSDTGHVNELDKSLCISLVLVFMAARNDVATKKTMESNRAATRNVRMIIAGAVGLWIVLSIIIIILMT